MISRELRALVQLAAPIVAAQIGSMLLGVVDTIMVGHLSKTALAAVALGSTFSFGAMILGQGTLHALDPVVSQAHGAGEKDAIALALERGVVLALGLSVPYLALFWWSEPLLVACKQPPEVVALTAPFLRALAPGVPAFFLFVAFRQTLQGMGVTRPVVIAVAVGNVANFVGNWILIYGVDWGPLHVPALGVVGSGWSTSICRVLMCVVLGQAAWSMVPSLRVDRRALAWAPLKRLLALGLPIGVQIGLEAWVFTAAALLIGSIGPVEMAGHQIAINLASLSFMVPLGIGAAASTRVGNAIGRADQAGARLAAEVALATGGAVMVGSAILFALLPGALARIYSPDAGVIAQAAVLIRIAALFQIFDGTQAVGCGVLRGAGDTRAAAVINLVGYWVLGLPLGAWWAFHLKAGPRGLWWGLTLGLAFVAVLVSARIVTRFRRTIARV